MTPRGIFVAVLIAAAWWLSLSRMSGAMMGPGDLGAFSAFAVTWTAMMAAMMLPSVLPSLAVGRPAPGRSLGAAARSVTAIGIYIAAWTMVGIGAFCVIAAVRMMDVGVLSWSRGGPYVAGAAILSAAIYEVTPLKRACLLRCRASVGMARGGSVASLAYSVNCIGCCAGLMVTMFALGVMNLAWMFVLALVLFAEKVLSHGQRLIGPIAVLLVVVGVWVALDPSSVPGLPLPMR